MCVAPIHEVVQRFYTHVQTGKNKTVEMRLTRKSRPFRKRLTNPVPLIVLSFILFACGRASPTPPQDEPKHPATTAPLPRIPSYEVNARNWEDGPPRARLELTINGMEVIAVGSGEDPSPAGRISACSYSFGDGSSAVPSLVDDAGNCFPVSHTYDEAGGYNVVLAVWDDLGMIGQTIELVVVGETPSDAERIETQIAGCLQANAWVPEGSGPFPAIVHYTPYPIDDIRPNGVFLASGLATIYVTNRGQGSSCGATDLFGQNAQNDLFLIDQWLSGQPWASGEYCLQGHSGPGLLATLSSAASPPGLRCAFVGGADAKIWETIVTKSGAWWPLAPYWITKTYLQAAIKEPYTRIPPLIDYLITVHSRKREPSFADVRDHTEDLQTLNVPMLFETSWDDLAWGAGPLGGPYLDLVQKMVHPGSAVIIYPGPHPSFDPSNERPFRSAFQHGVAIPGDVREFILNYLSDGQEFATTQYNYLYFQLQGGVQAALLNHEYGGWKTSNNWPPEDTSPLTLYLHPDPSGTIASRYDGLLSEAAPGEETLMTPFTYHAAPVWDPVYSSGGTPWKFYSFPDMRWMDLEGLTFTSSPLVRDAVIEGPLELTLTAATDLHDFDWMVILSDVWPDGSSHRVSSGFLRASLRNHFEIYEPRPRGWQTYHITLASIANVFQAGHRIRLTIHQVNSDDTDPKTRSTGLRLGPGSGELILHVEGGLLALEPYAECTACDTQALADEHLYPYFTRYVSGAVAGRDPASGEEIRLGFWASLDQEQRTKGAVLIKLSDAVISAVGIEAIFSPRASEYDYRIILPEDYEMFLRCGIDGNPGTVLIMDETRSLGPIQVTEGVIRCYDVPYVNW